MPRTKVYERIPRAPADAHKALGGRPRMRIGYRTHLVRERDGSVALTHWGQTIATYHPSGAVTLEQVAYPRRSRHGLPYRGYSRSTLKRIACLLPEDWSLDLSPVSHGNRPRLLFRGERRIMSFDTPLRFEPDGTARIGPGGYYSYSLTELERMYADIREEPQAVRTRPTHPGWPTQFREPEPEPEPVPEPEDPWLYSWQPEPEPRRSLYDEMLARLIFTATEV